MSTAEKVARPSDFALANEVSSLQVESPEIRVDVVDSEEQSARRKHVKAQFEDSLAETKVKQLHLLSESQSAWHSIAPSRSVAGSSRTGVLSSSQAPVIKPAQPVLMFIPVW